MRAEYAPKKLQELVFKSFHIAGTILSKIMYIEEEYQQALANLSEEEGSFSFQQINSLTCIESPSSCYAPFLTCHPIVVSYFGCKFMEELGNHFEGVKQLAFDLFEDMKSLETFSLAMELIQSKTLDIIMSSTLHVSQRFFMYETWTYDSRQFQLTKTVSDETINVTVFTKLFHMFQKSVFKNLIYIVSSKILLDTKKDKSQDIKIVKSLASDELLSIQVSTKLLDKIKSMFLEGQYYFLDCLDLLVSSRDDTLISDDNDETRWDSSGLKLSTDKNGQFVLVQTAQGMKFTSKADENKDSVRLHSILESQT